MVLLNNFNRTYFENDLAIWSKIEHWFWIEIFFIGFNICHTLFFLYINIISKQFHQNWTNVMSVLYIQHSIADLAWIGDRLILLWDIDQRYDYLAKLCSYIRVVCIFQGLLVLPILIIERAFATSYISDYESEQRLHISYTLIVILFIFGCIASIGFHEFELHLIIFTAILLFNILGIIGNSLIFRQNRKYFKEFYNRERVLNLTERFQIAENIKICRLINMIVISMGGFNALICLTVLVDFLKVSKDHRNFFTLLFDISTFIYSTLFPYICMYYSAKWKYRFFEIFGCFRSNQTHPDIQLQDTFGSVIIESTTDAHFETVASSWR